MQRKNLRPPPPLQVADRIKKHMSESKVARILPKEVREGAPFAPSKKSDKRRRFSEAGGRRARRARLPGGLAHPSFRRVSLWPQGNELR